MTDMGMIGGIAASLNTAAGIAKTMLNLRDLAVIQEKVIELQGVILTAQAGALSAQADHFSLLERIRTLETQVADLKIWEAEKQKYKLTALVEGTFAYSLKETTGSPEQTHLLCANCFQHNSKSILQRERRYPGATDTWACHECGADIYVSGAPHPDHFKGRPTRRQK